LFFNRFVAIVAVREELAAMRDPPLKWIYQLKFERL